MVSSLKVGDKVLGVRFSDKDFPEIGWAESMEYYVGMEGTIHYIEEDGSVTVYFPNDDFWNYPLELLSKVEEE